VTAAVILNYKNLKLLTVGHAKKVELLHCAKFRLNRSNRGRDIEIPLLFFEMECLGISLLHDVAVTKNSHHWSSDLYNTLHHVVGGVPARLAMLDELLGFVVWFHLLLTLHQFISG